METANVLEHLKKRRQLFLHFRWLLFLWQGATFTVHHDALSENSALATGLISLMALSQLGLWKAPLKYFEGLKFFYAVFLFDMLVIMLNLLAQGQMQRDLVITLFLGTFISALTKDVKASALASLILATVFVGMKLGTPDDFHPEQAGQLLSLPFLLIASVHSGLLAQEAQIENDTMQLLAKDRGRLVQNLTHAFTEAARQNHGIAALFDSLPFGMLMLDKDGRVEFFNSMCEFMFGLRSKNVRGYALDELPALKCLQEPLLQTADKLDINFHFIAIPGEGSSPIHATLSAYNIEDGGQGSLGTLVLLMAQPYHQAVANYFDALRISGEVPSQDAPLAYADSKALAYVA